jgi:transcriptional regulator with XRE-family HTH domain
VEAAASQFLRALRGRRSQQAWAKRLGYKGNPLTDWENGRSFPHMSEVLRVAGVARIDVVAAFERFNPNVPLSKSNAGYDLGAWLRATLGSTSVSEVARRMAYSRSSLSRWVCGASEPRVPEFLAFVDAATGRVQDWVAELVAIEQVPTLLARHEAARAAKQLAFSNPWTEALLRVIELQGYLALPEHEDGAFAARLGLPLEVVQGALRALVDARVIERRGAHYVVLSQLTVDTAGGKHQLHALKAHWATVAADRARTPHPGDVFGYNVLSASREDVERIRTVLKNAFREVRAIVSASEPAECVALVNVQLVGWE